MAPNQGVSLTPRIKEFARRRWSTGPVPVHAARSSCRDESRDADRQPYRTSVARYRYENVTLRQRQGWPSS